MRLCKSLPWTRTRGSSRRRSTKSTTRTMSLPRRIRQSSRRTATLLTRSSGWICALNRWLSRCRRSKRTATTRSSSSTATPTILATSARAPRGPRQATIWWSAPTGKVKRQAGSRRSSDRRRRSRSRLSALNSLTPATCRTLRKFRPATKRSRFRAFLNVRPRPPRRRSSSFLPPLPGSRIIFLSTSTRPCNTSLRRRGTRRFARNLRRLASVPARPSCSRIYRSNIKPKSWWA